jgi:endonuclease/exonuclease/phosphatase family metal-dependent hydrolase
MPLRVLTWNLFHGRSEPETPRSLLPEFAARIAELEWDVALLQEVLPWWPPLLGRAAGASARMALTSRNLVPAIQHRVAPPRPHVLKSWSGGCNTILVRGQAIREHRVERLRAWPERRVAHGVLLEDGTWATNLHAQVHRDQRAQADLDRAAAVTMLWAAGAPTVLGGDLNLHGRPTAFGYRHLGGHYVDHVLGRGMRVVERARALPHAPLSDHAPVEIVVEPGR